MYASVTCPCIQACPCPCSLTCPSLHPRRPSSLMLSILAHAVCPRPRRRSTVHHSSHVHVPRPCLRPHALIQSTHEHMHNWMHKYTHTQMNAPHCNTVYLGDMMTVMYCFKNTLLFIQMFVSNLLIVHPS